MVRKGILIILGSALLVVIGIVAMSLRGQAEILLPSAKAEGEPHISVGDQFVKS